MPQQARARRASTGEPTPRPGGCPFADAVDSRAETHIAPVYFAGGDGLVSAGGGERVPQPRARIVPLR